MAHLLTRIPNDDFLEPVSSWVSCVDPSNAHECALQWATESNKWTCEYVYSELGNGTDLLESGYAMKAFPIVEMQISKAAVRLGIWLNRLVGEEEDEEGFEYAGQNVLREHS